MVANADNNAGKMSPFKPLHSNQSSNTAYEGSQYGKESSAFREPAYRDNPAYRDVTQYNKNPMPLRKLTQTPVDKVRSFPTATQTFVCPVNDLEEGEGHPQGQKGKKEGWTGGFLRSLLHKD
jgi:hypothetical protein